MSNSLRKIRRKHMLKSRKETEKQFKEIARVREERIKLYEKTKKENQDSK